jgi:hypothetical protein
MSVLFATRFIFGKENGVKSKGRVAQMSRKSVWVPVDIRKSLDQEEACEGDSVVMRARWHFDATMQRL